MNVPSCGRIFLILRSTLGLLQGTIFQRIDPSSTSWSVYSLVLKKHFQLRFRLTAIIYRCSLYLSCVSFCPIRDKCATEWFQFWCPAEREIRSTRPKQLTQIEYRSSCFGFLLQTFYETCINPENRAKPLTARRFARWSGLLHSSVYFLLADLSLQTPKAQAE